MNFEKFRRTIKKLTEDPGQPLLRLSDDDIIVLHNQQKWPFSNGRVNVANKKLKDLLKIKNKQKMEN